MGGEADDGLAVADGTDAAARTVHVLPHGRRTHADVPALGRCGGLCLIRWQDGDHRTNPEPRQFVGVLQAVGRQADYEPLGICIRNRASVFRLKS